MGYRLFLDDERSPRDVTWVDCDYSGPWTIVRTMEEFIQTIKMVGVPAFISFDHDLADEHYQAYDNGMDHFEHTLLENTGYRCAQWLVDFCLVNDVKIPEFVVHSMNPIGKENIEKYIENARRVLYNESNTCS